MHLDNCYIRLVGSPLWVEVLSVYALSLSSFCPVNLAMAYIKIDLLVLNIYGISRRAH